MLTARYGAAPVSLPSGSLLSLLSFVSFVSLSLAARLLTRCTIRVVRSLAEYTSDVVSKTCAMPRSVAALPIRGAGGELRAPERFDALGLLAAQVFLPVGQKGCKLTPLLLKLPHPGLIFGGQHAVGLDLQAIEFLDPLIGKSLKSLDSRLIRFRARGAKHQRAVLRQFVLVKLRHALDFIEPLRQFGRDLRSALRQLLRPAARHVYALDVHAPDLPGQQGGLQVGRVHMGLAGVYHDPTRADEQSKRQYKSM